MTKKINIDKLISDGPFMTVSTARTEFGTDGVRLSYRTLMKRAVKYGVKFKNQRKKK